MARAWGFWTKGKLNILRDYLDAFTTASKSSSEILYLDLFAGEPENVDRISDAPIDSSPWIALQTNDPPFARLRFFERDNAEALSKVLQSEFGGREMKVYPGDCNETVYEALDDLADVNWAPAFAFIDPTGPDVLWETLQALAEFKANRRYKMELWMLFAEPMFVRLLRVDGQEVRPQDLDRITGMFGTAQWQEIYEARVQGKLKPPEARGEYVNLMRWRMENVLGYDRTHAFEVRNERGAPIYHLIFATDHSAGDRIVTHLYEKALVDFPKMRQEAIEERHGVQKLFDDFEYQDAELKYAYEAPWEPYGTGGGD